MWNDSSDSGGASAALARRSSLHARLSESSAAGYQQQCLNFSTCELEPFSSPMKRSRSVLDSQSHRVIEKRRRDRMNNCLADLGQLVSDDGSGAGGHIKHGGQGRIKKTEIIEMAIDRIRLLQSQLRASQLRDEDRLLTGFKECRDVAIRFLVDQHGQDSVGPLCTGLLLHLQEHLQSICRVGGPTAGRDAANSGPAAAASRHMNPASATAHSYGSAINGAAVSSLWPQKTEGVVFIKPEISTPEMATGCEEMAANVPRDLSLTSLTAAAAAAVSDLQMTKGRSLAATVATSTVVAAVAGNNVQPDSRAEVDMCDVKQMNSPCTDPTVTSPAGEASAASIATSASARQLGGYAAGAAAAAAAYKYKDSIKRRFCSESDARSPAWNESASESSCCAAEESSGGGAAVDSPACSPRSQHVAGDQSPIKSNNDDSAVLGCCSASRSHSRRRCYDIDDEEEEEELRTERSPGFILHPTGAYYVPVVASTNQLRLKLKQVGADNGRRPQTVCHPVSIPVNFLAAHGSSPLVSIDSLTASSSSVELLCSSTLNGGGNPLTTTLQHL